MAQKTFNIIYKGSKLGNFVLLKSAKLSSGYTVCLFRGEPYCHIFNYIVAVRRGDETIEFHRMTQLRHPFCMYFDLICCYA